jgi:hypothetical protein
MDQNKEPYTLVWSWAHQLSGPRTVLCGIHKRTWVVLGVMKVKLLFFLMVYGKRVLGFRAYLVELSLK